MESKINNDDKIKNLGQVPTPDSIVNFMLDANGYSRGNILNKHILDNSCGEGAFLKNVVKRYGNFNNKRGQSEYEKNVKI